MAGERRSEGGELAARVRRIDPDRYLTALFAPPERRPGLFALIAFNYEIARVREAVTEPILGQIRLQWWREAVEKIYAGSPPPPHETAMALAAAVAEHRLDRDALEWLMDARETDLSPTPPERLEDLIVYASTSAGTLLELMLQVLGVEHDAAAEDAARAAGTGYALTGLIRSIPFHARARRVYIPQSLLAEHGLSAEDLFEAKPPDALPAMARELARLARLHLDEAREEMAHTPRRAIPALLSATVAEAYLKRLRRAEYDVFDPAVGERPPGLVWRLAAKAWRGRW
jgi:NADH dehydrogenase [ubiquinone] 1 alpha subcomplex assembly factor 6